MWHCRQINRAFLPGHNLVQIDAIGSELVDLDITELNIVVMPISKC